MPSLSKKYYHNIDLDSNQLISAVIENRSSAPASGTDGQVYYNTVDKKIYYYNAGLGQWLDIGGGSVTSVGLSVPSGFTISGSPITSAGTLALSFAAGYSLPTTDSQNNWNTAYGWGNHATAGYLTSFSEIDPTVPAYVKAITNQQITDWNTAYSWGNHALANYINLAIGDGRYVRLAVNYNNPNWLNSLAWSKITGTPTTVSGYGITDVYTDTEIDGILEDFVHSSRQLTINGVTYDLSANRSWTISSVTGSGTAGYLAKWDSASNLVNSVIYDNGTAVGINTTSVNASTFLHLRASATRTKSVILDSSWSYQTSWAMINGIYSAEFNLGGSTKSGAEGGPGSLQISTYNSSTGVFKYPITAFSSGAIAFTKGSTVPIDDGVNTLQVTGSIRQTDAISALLRADSTGKIVTATAGVDYQAALQLTTTGSSGASTLIGNTLNIPDYQGLVPTGGATGQILAKIDTANYNTEWIDNYTSSVKHLVKLGESMTKGTPVYVSSADGTNMVVSKASYTGEGTSSKTFGILAESGSTNDQRFVITEGLLEGLNTSGAVDGDPIWLGPNGTMIFGLANKPVAPNHLVLLGFVTRSQINNGEIFVKIQNGFEIEELHNVLITTVQDKHILYRDAATSLWKNASIATVLGYTPENAANKGAANGYASLDAGGKVPISQLPSSIMEYKGTWNASTNTPSLTNGVGDTGDVYKVSVGGTYDFGSGNITFATGDYVIYNGSVWEKSGGTDGVVSVNGLTGVVTLTTSDITEDTNLYYTDVRSRAAISLTTAGTSGVAAYDNSTGVLNIPQYQAALTNPVTGTGVSGQIPYWTGTTTLSGSSVFTFGPNAQLLINNTVPASSGIARGQNITTSLTASANNDTLVALDINPTFTPGAYTGVTSLGLRLVNSQLRIDYGISGALTFLNFTTNQFGVNNRFGVSNAGSFGAAALGLWDGTRINGFFGHGGSNTNLGVTIGGTQVGTWFATGNLFIGETPTDGGFKLDVNGTSRVQGRLTLTNDIYFTNYSTTGIVITGPNVVYPLITIGSQNTASGNTNILIGQSNEGTGGAYVLGSSNIANSNGSVIVGQLNQANTSGQFTILIGGSNTTSHGVTTFTGTFAIGNANVLAHQASAIMGSNQTTTANNQLIIAATQSNVNSAGFNDIYFGTGPRSKNTNLLGSNITINGSGAGAGTDLSGGNVTIAGGKGTGAGTPGDVIISTATATTSGTTLQSLTTRFRVAAGTGNVTVASLAGSGSRMVVADANGLLSTQAIPSGGGPESVTSVFGRTGAVVAQSGDYESNQITESATNLFYTNARAREAINVTTNNNSGLATYNSATGVINIPNYTLSGLGGVPTSRSLTINGTAYDLSADRSWTIPAVTSVGLSVPTGLSVSNSPITSTGTLAITYASGYSIPTTTSQSNWDSAYTATNAATNSNTANTIVKRDANGKFVTSAVQANYIDYVPTNNLNRPEYLKGRLYYNSEASSLIMYSDNPDVELLIGERTWIRCRNTTGAPIPKGSPVYVAAGVHIPGNPVHGHHMDVAMADASDVTKTDVVGIAAETIADGAHGYVISKGYLTGINTSALTVGNRFHLGFQQPGTLVADAPEYPNFPVDLGICLTDSDISPRNIASITLGNPVQITTTAAHDFEDFLQVSFAGIVGTTQLNGNTYYLDTVSSTQFNLYTDVNLSVPLDGTGFTAYISGGTVTPTSHYGAVYVDLQNHSIEKLRVTGSSYIDGNLTVGGDLTIIGASSNISVSSLNVADNWVYVGAGDTVTATFTGSGLNDLSFRGHYTGTINRTFYVKISSTGATDTFSWSYDDFATTEGSNIAITGAEQTLAFGIKVKFEAVTGHTLNDKWSGTGTIKNVDFGFYGNYSTPSYTHAGFFRDATDGEFKFFSSYTPEITGNVDTTDPSFALATVRANTFIGNLTGNASTVTDGIYTSNTYNNPSWITGLAWSKITSVPANLTSLAALTYTSGAFVKMTGANTFTLDTSTYLTANQSITLSGDLSGSGTTSISATIANQAVTYAKIQNVADNRILGRSAGSAGTVQEITIGTGLQLTGGILSSTSAGGSVTTVSVVSANGFAGTVANASSTPAITLTTSVSGLLKGNGTAISAAVGNSDYLAVNNPKYTGILETGSLSFGPQASNVLAALESSANSYNQFLTQNSSSGVNASSDIIVNNDVSTDTTFYGDYGINGSNYNGNGSFNIPSAVYLYSASTDLVIGTFGNAPIHFVVNGGVTDAAVIKTTSQLQLPAYTSSTSFTGTAAGYLAFDSSGNVITVSAPGQTGYTIISVSTTHNETATSGTKIIKADTTGGAFSINLPTAAGNTATIVIKKTAGTAALTVDASASQTIDGGLTAVLNKVNESITLVSDNANWQII